MRKGKFRKEIFKKFRVEKHLIYADRNSRYRIHMYRKVRGELFRYIYQLEHFFLGRWRVVVRHDNFHDFFHKDVFDTRGKRIERIAIEGKTKVSQAMKLADKDLKANREKYIKEFRSRVSK